MNIDAVTIDANEALPVPGLDSGRPRARAARGSGAAPGEGDYTDFPFLKSDEVVSFPQRLRKEVLDFAATVAKDPRVLFTPSRTSKASAKDRQRRFGTGFLIAGAIYGIVFTSAYAFYLRERTQGHVPSQENQSRIVFLAPLPIPVRRPTVSKLEPVGSGQRAVAQPGSAAPSLRAPSTAATPVADHDDLAKTVISTPVDSKSNASAPSSVGSPSGVAGGVGGLAAGLSGFPGAGGGAGSGITSPASYDGVFSVASVTTRPRIVSRQVPGYTDDARRNQVEGSVRVSVVLKSDGTVGDVAIVKGLGYGLDEKALEAARHLQFISAEKDGHKVSARVFLEFKFSLL